MALNSTGPISLGGSTTGQSIALELGLSPTATISLNDTAVRTLFGTASGAINMNTAHGKANEFRFTIDSDTANFDAYPAAMTAGWNGTSKLNVIINSGVYVYSLSTGTPALTVSGSFPGGVQLINSGIIVGRGGNGGTGGNGSNGPSATAGTTGFGGGTALSVSVALSVDNTSGTIAGGGGGGGGGGGFSAGVGRSTQAASGSGGSGGIGVATGGAAGVENAVYGAPGNAGNSGTLTAAGARQPGVTYNTQTGGYGGAGGAYGSAGEAGGAGSGSGNLPSSGAGGAAGAAGACTSGNANITWVATGTRFGALN
jgi:hypothetical protein